MANTSIIKELAERIEREAPFVLDVDGLKDRLVAVSEAVADQDDRGAQAILRETLRMLAAAPQQAPQAAQPYTGSYLKPEVFGKPVHQAAPIALPLSDEQINDGLKLHHLTHEKPSQLADGFRAGVHWAERVHHIKGD
jgi:hypothetical protein